MNGERDGGLEVCVKLGAQCLLQTDLVERPNPRSPGSLKTSLEFLIRNACAGCSSQDFTDRGQSLVVKGVGV